MLQRSDASPIRDAKGSVAAAFLSMSMALPALAAQSIGYATYYGGSERDLIAQIAVDAAGFVYAVGATESTDFPTIGALQPALGDPGDLEALFRLGTLQAEIGRAVQARQSFLRAVDYAEKNPVRDGESLAWLGRCLIALGGRGNIERASQFLVDSMRTAPDRPEARTSRGILKFQVYNEALGFENGEGDLKRVLDQNGEVEETLRV